MKVNVDTNFLVCLAPLDDPGEAQAAQAALQRVELIAVTLLSPLRIHPGPERQLKNRA